MYWFDRWRHECGQGVTAWALQVPRRSMAQLDLAALFVHRVPSEPEPKVVTHRALECSLLSAAKVAQNAQAANGSTGSPMMDAESFDNDEEQRIRRGE